MRWPTLLWRTGYGFHTAVDATDVWSASGIVLEDHETVQERSGTGQRFDRYDREVCDDEGNA